jgi:ABC-type ATPase with predicted acetyltransferase domain
MTQRLLARAMFDLPPRPIDPVPDAAATARAVDRTLDPGHIALITGPSGAGKSTILRHLSALLRDRGHAAFSVDPARLPSRRRVIDAFHAPLVTTLSLLSSCGLADATILERRTHELSTGQRWRLSLALALRRAQRRGPHATLLIDELGSTLDDVTARCLCRTLRRWIEPRAIRATCATHDDSLMEFLAPSVLVIQPLRAPATIETKFRLSGDRSA